MKRLYLRSKGAQSNLLWLAWLLLALITLAYVVLIGHQAILRYDTFKATGFDLGNYDQAIWNTLHGRLFRVTNHGQDWYGPYTRLAMHFEPIILPLSLLYLLYPDPRTLLVFQTLALASGSLPVFLLTRKYLPSLPLAAPFMAAAYLFSPALLAINIFDFHPVALATPLLLYAMLALTYRRYVWFIVACVLAAACKEDVPFAVALLGVLVIWKYKSPRLGSALLIGGLLWGLLAFTVIIPHFYPGGNNYLSRYAALGSTPKEALMNVLLHPWLLITTYITLDRFYYLANLFRSAGFLSLLAPEWLLGALFSLAVNLLSTDDKIYSGVFHYNAAIIPFIMLSAIHGLARLVALWHTWRGEAQEHVPLAVPASAHAHAMPAFIGAPVAALQFVFAHLTAARFAIAQSTFAHSAQAVVMRPVALMQPGFSSLARLRTHQWQRFSERMADLARLVPLSSLQWVVSAWIVAMIVLNFVIMTPLLNIFWANHEPGSREQHIEQLLAMIPPDVPVSAGENLNPHLSERQYVTVFPDYVFSVPGSNSVIVAQYIIVDLDNVFPEDKVSTARVLNELLRSGQFRILARAEGVILLVRNSP